MEAVLRAFPRDHHRYQSTLAPSKQNKIKTPTPTPKRRNIRRSNTFISNNNPSPGLLNPPPPPIPLDYPHAHALVLSSSSSSKSYQQQNHHQPPLLPLPTTINPLQLSPRSTTRNVSFTPKKSSSKPTMRDNDIEVKKRSSATQSTSEFLIPIFFTSSMTMTGNENDIGLFSVSSFNVVSPPPSSLPMPKFCLRSKLKLSCNAKNSEDRCNAGATHNLRRIPHLQ